MTLFGNKIYSALRRTFTAVALLTSGAAMAAPDASANDNITAPAVDKAQDKTQNRAQEMEDRANRLLAAGHSPYYDRVIVLDPDRFDAELGKGKSRIGAVQHMLADKGYDKPRDEFVRTLVERLTLPVLSATGAPVLVADAQGFQIPNARLSVVIMTPENSLHPGIPAPPGVPPNLAIRARNEHELAHALDPVTDMSLVAPYEFLLYSNKPLKYMPWADFPRMEMVPSLAGAYAMLSRAEAFADVRGLGEMVRGGEEPSLLMDYADWRMWEMERDPLHTSTLALRALAKEVSAMGVEEFRALDDAQAEALYVSAAQENGLTSERALLSFLFCAYGTQDQKAFVRSAAQEDAEARNGVEVYTMWNLPTYIAPPPPPDTESARKDVAARLEGWDAAAELRRAALENHRSLSRPAVHEAYVEMRDGLRTQARENPQDGLYYQEKGALLRAAYLSRVLDVTLVQKPGGEIILRRNRSAARPQLSMNGP